MGRPVGRLACVEQVVGSLQVVVFAKRPLSSNHQLSKLGIAMAPNSSPETTVGIRRRWVRHTACHDGLDIAKRAYSVFAVVRARRREAV